MLGQSYAFLLSKQDAQPENRACCLRSSGALAVGSLGQLLPKGRSSYFSSRMTRGVIFSPAEGASPPVCEV